MNIEEVVKRLESDIINLKKAHSIDLQMVRSDRDAARAELSDALASIDGLTAINTNLALDRDALDRKFTEYVGDVMRAPELCTCSPEVPGVFECSIGCYCVCHSLYGQLDELKEENLELKARKAQLQEGTLSDIRAHENLTAELTRSQELLASARAQSESHLQARLEAQSAQDGAEYELGEERRALNASRTLFRRLAKRYLEMRKGLRRDLKEWQSHSRYGWEGFDTQARRANEAERRAYELQKRVDEWAERYSWAEVQTEYARNVAMGSAFELGRALKLLRHLDSCSPKSGCDVAAWVASFDAPGGAK